MNWAKAHILLIYFIQADCPYQNAYIEDFNRPCIGDVLDFYIFKNLNEMKQITHDWMQIYNNEPPHDSLNDITPVEYKNTA